MSVLTHPRGRRAVKRREVSLAVAGARALAIALGIVAVALDVVSRLVRP